MTWQFRVENICELQLHIVACWFKCLIPKHSIQISRTEVDWAVSFRGPWFPAFWCYAPEPEYLKRVLFLCRYTEHSTVDLAQQWDQLDQLAMRMKHNLEQQIQARNTTGVSEETLKEFTIMFK